VRARSRTTAALAVIFGAIVAISGLAGAGSAAPQQGDTLVALISDVGRFNDKSFNQSQLEGLNRAKRQLGVRTLPLQSNSDADYIPNLTTAVRRGADLVVCAGFLMATDCARIAKRFPDTQFAITDYPVNIPPFANNRGRVITKNVTGLTYAAHEGGCLVGHMAGLMARRAGGPQVIGAVAGVKIPPVDIWVAGYRYCARKANPRVRVLIGYSQDFVASDKCKAVAENQIARGAKVLFQVAGGCGLGTLRAADEAGIWGIGVDKDQFRDARRVMTSGVKRVDQGVFLAARALVRNQKIGGINLNFNLKNGGMDLGRTSRQVPRSILQSTNRLKRQIIAGRVKIPTSL
jgi:basic membrane protein A and related proteins